MRMIDLIQSQDRIFKGVCLDEERTTSPRRLQSVEEQWLIEELRIIPSHHQKPAQRYRHGGTSFRPIEEVPQALRLIHRH